MYHFSALHLLLKKLDAVIENLCLALGSRERVSQRSGALIACVSLHAL